MVKLTIDPNGRAIVLYWYDARHHETGAVDNVHMYLQYSYNGSTWSNAVSDTTAHKEEKKRVYWNDFSGGNRKWRLIIQGANVTADNAG